jgi:hypothetical protein
MILPARGSRRNNRESLPACRKAKGHTIFPNAFLETGTLDYVLRGRVRSAFQ